MPPAQVWKKRAQQAEAQNEINKSIIEELKATDETNQSTIKELQAQNETNQSTIEELKATNVAHVEVTAEYEQKVNYLAQKIEDLGGEAGTSYVQRYPVPFKPLKRHTISDLVKIIRDLENRVNFFEKCLDKNTSRTVRLKKEIKELKVEIEKLNVKNDGYQTKIAILSKQAERAAHYKAELEEQRKLVEEHLNANGNGPRKRR